MMKKILRTAGYILLLVFAYMAFQVCFTFISMTAGVLFAYLKGVVSIDSIAQLGDYNTLLSSPETEGIYTWAMSAGLFLSALAMLLFLYLIRGYRIKLSLFNSMPSKSLLYSTLLVFSSMFALNIFVQWFGLEDKLSGELEGIAHNVLGVITISLIAPLLEEVLFRGAIQGYMMRRYSPWVAIVSAALVFGIFHFNPVQTLYATLIGIVFGWIYYRTGSLLSVIVGHVLNNSIASFALLSFPESEALPMSVDMMPASVQVVSEVFTFVFFVLLSINFAVKLHRIQPPVSLPWRDVTDAVQ